MLTKTAPETAMNNLLKITYLIVVLLGSSSSLYAKSVVIYSIGNSTVANYSDPFFSCSTGRLAHLPGDKRDAPRPDDNRHPFAEPVRRGSSYDYPDWDAC